MKIVEKGYSPGAKALMTTKVVTPGATTFSFRNGILSNSAALPPAGQRIKIEITNAGGSAAEFESIPLRKEKVVAPGVTTFVVIKALAPGEYPFFDDFHPKTAQGVIVAK